MIESESRKVIGIYEGILPSKNSMKKLFTRRSYCNRNSFCMEPDKYDSGILENLNAEIKSIRLSNIFLSLFSIFSYLFDFFSDIYLIITYYNQDNFIWFFLTFMFVFIPAIIMTIFSLIWYWSDKDLKFSFIGWVIRLILHLFQLALVVRYTDKLIYSLKSKYAVTKEEKQLYYHMMIFEEADSALLRVMECSMESTPQLLLQLYILFTQPQVQNHKVIVIQSVSTLLSLVSLSWCFTVYQTSLRLTTPGKKEMKISSMIIMVFWKLFVILPRFLSIALFTSVYKLYVLIILGIHYLLMATYIIAQETTFFSSKKFTLREILFNLVVAVIYCVDFLNLKEGFTRYRYFLFYGISFTEIVTLIFLWYFYSPFYSGNHSLASIINTTTSKDFYYQMWSVKTRKLVVLEIILCFIFAIILMIVYYMYFHPTKAIRICPRKSKKLINFTGVAGDSPIVQVDSSTLYMESISQESI